MLGSTPMTISSRSVAWCRVAILVWACAWMLAVPLFHVHPDVDHRHGEATHVHAGTVHTVLSHDLDCESDSHDQIGANGEAAHPGTTLSSHVSHSGVGHPEFGFSFLNDSNDRKAFKPFFAPVLAGACAVVIDPHQQEREDQPDALAPAIPSVIHEIPSRAPPSFLI